MTKQCPQCKRILEFNEFNFRLSCDGYWRNTCRDCENKHKRMMYKHEKTTKVKKPNPYKEAREQRLQAAIDKYDKIFKTLERLGVSPDAPAEYVDKVLENVSNRKSA